jgi:hypothetical protein
MVHQSGLKVSIIVCIFFLLTSGCVTQSPKENVTSSLPPIFTVPMGGFVHPENYTIRDSNSTFESDYLFYSGIWGPGEVKFSIYGEYKNQTWNDSSELYVEPSSFTVEPDHAYTAKVFLNTSSIPKDFFIPQPNWNIPTTVIAGHPYHLYMNADLDGKTSQYCNDSIPFYSYTFPYRSFDEIRVEKGSLSLKKGDTKYFNLTYSPNWDTGMGEISYLVSQTPLNVSITPSRFFARSFFYPANQDDFLYHLVTKISAPSHLDSGQYLVSITQQGGGKDPFIRCTECKEKDSQQKMFVVNVTVE